MCVCVHAGLIASTHAGDADAPGNAPARTKRLHPRTSCSCPCYCLSPACNLLTALRAPFVFAASLRGRVVDLRCCACVSLPAPHVCLCLRAHRVQLNRAHSPRNVMPLRSFSLKPPSRDAGSTTNRARRSSSCESESIAAAAAFASRPRLPRDHPLPPGQPQPAQPPQQQQQQHQHQHQHQHSPQQQQQQQHHHHDRRHPCTITEASEESEEGGHEEGEASEGDEQEAPGVEAGMMQVWGAPGADAGYA